MAGIQDFWEFVDDFFGNGTFVTTSAGNDPWEIADTSAAGAPTYTRVDGSSTGEANLALASTSEVQNVCLSFGDTLCFDIDLLRAVEFRVKVSAATIDSAVSVAFGLAGDRNDTIDSIAQAALFRLIGDNSVVVESDDGTTNNDDVATGLTLGTAYRRFKIDFSNGTSDVRFFVENSSGGLVRVASGTTFDMSAYTGSLQPLVQIQKTADAAADSVSIDYVKVWGVRS